MRKPGPFIAVLVAGMASLAMAAPAAAGDSSDSMRVGDMQYGNSLDPLGWAPLLAPDPRGFSWLHAGMMRTPSGALYPYPPMRDAVLPDSAGWTHQGILQLGYLHAGGDDHAQFFRQYADWTNGAVLGLLGLYFDNPRTGSYVEFRGSRISGDDQFYRLRAGRYGHFKVQAFYRDMPHAVATDAYPLWDGIGGTDLTVPAGLAPGASTPAQVAAVEAGRPRHAVGLVRTREGLSLEGNLYKDWIGFASVVNEQRNGTRLWGGPMFFNYILPDNGGALETVRPIDFSTTDINLGLRFVGTRWHFNSVYTGSFFRNHKDHLDFQSPFALHNVVGTPNVGNIDQGEFSLEPDNDYHNLRLELSRSMKWNGELSMAAAWGTMRQNDALRPPVTCTGSGGILVAPTVDYTFNCADWNTTDALSQKTADARIDTGLLDAKLTFRPSPAFGWHTELRWYKEDNKTNYLAYNPLTGQYGYISENGSQGSVIPGETGIFDPSNPLYQSYMVQVRSIPFAYQDTLFELGGDWQLGDDQSLDLTYTFDHNQPRHRERKRVDESRIKLAWVDRALGKGTLRFSYEYARRGGDAYDYDPYEAFYSSALPGFVPSPSGAVAFTTDAMRKYDLSDRTEHKARAIVIYPVGDTATLSATLYGTLDDYTAQIGRQDTRNGGVNLAWDWQPTPLTSISANLGRDASRLRMSNVADVEDLVGPHPEHQDPSLGGPLYPYANQWWDIDNELDDNAGVTWMHSFKRVRVDASYTWTYSRSELHYRYASSGALPITQVPYVDEIGSGFPDNHYRVNSFNLGFTFDFSEHLGLRLFGRYEIGSFLDWHYAGLQDTPVIDHRIYTDRGPQQRYNASLVGAMLNVKL
ncbi:MAG TPA: MtrB/PioB family outer membrane beta-barrel protein [Rhodanobacteraceae bacterium]|nr:MtrB/PioB family outer membrane beta-barrel protein [Rhodanobacteraceae bacterium]